MKYWTPDTFEVNCHSHPFTSGRRYNNVVQWKETYSQLNELGFRGDSIHKDGFKIMTVGCSHTEGACVNDDETWPYYLAQLMNCLHYNCSVAGSSNDFMSRTILTFTDVIKPDIVLVMYTAIERLEFYKNDNIYAFAPNAWGYFTDVEEGQKDYTDIVNAKTDDNDKINWFKNHLLITNYLKYKSIPFFWNSGFGYFDHHDDNRFYDDYTNFIGYTYDTVHASPDHNKLFAEKVYNFLKGRGF